MVELASTGNGTGRVVLDDLEFVKVACRKVEIEGVTVI